MSLDDIAYSDGAFFCRVGALERCPKLRRTVWPADGGNVPRAAGAGRRRSPRLRDSQRSGVTHRRQSPAEHGNVIWNHQAPAERWTDRGVAFTPRGFRRRTPPLLSIDAARPSSGGGGSCLSSIILSPLNGNVK